MQTHDNVESFRRLAEFRPSRTKTRIVYASSAATYGAASSDSGNKWRRPANVYAFSKVIMDNLARRAAEESRLDPCWSAILQRLWPARGAQRRTREHGLSSLETAMTRQMKIAGQRPRIFKHGEQQRDFVYVKDIVEGCLRAFEAERSGIYNLGSGQARSFNELVADS